MMKSGDARVALIGFPSVGKVSSGQHAQVRVCVCDDDVVMLHVVHAP